LKEEDFMEMGLVRDINCKKVCCEIPKNFVLTLKNHYRISNFIETGTYKGDTSSWAADYFMKVVTIEASEEFYNASLERFQREKKTNIYLYKGISSDILSDFDKLEINYLVEPTIFWLDAHWSRGNTFGKETNHPLLKELSLIRQSKVGHFIFIDDVRLLCHPCDMNLHSEWPLLGDVFWILVNENVKYNFSILGDCLFVFPDIRDIKLILNTFREDKYMNYL